MNRRREKREAARVTLGLYAALRDGRVADVLALLDPKVVCMPLVRPGLSVYYGHAAMIALVGDLHNRHGDYQVKVDQITQEDGPRGTVKVTAQARLLPEPGDGRPSEVPVTNECTVRDGLVTWIQSKPGARPPAPADPPSTAVTSGTGPSTPGPSTPGPSTPGPSTPGPSTPGPSTPGASTPGPSGPGPSTAGATGTGAGDSAAV
jgi:SnoaL-like protein